MKKFFNYIRESASEYRHIKWPTRNQTALFTVAVILISFAIAYYIGLFDLIFTKLIQLSI